MQLIQREGLSRGRAGPDADKKPCYLTEADGRAGDTLFYNYQLFGRLVITSN
jgi:hypothetical protein